MTSTLSRRGHGPLLMRSRPAAWMRTQEGPPREPRTQDAARLASQAERRQRGWGLAGSLGRGAPSQPTHSASPTRAHPGPHLILIGLLPAADGDVAGAHAHVHLVVAGDAPAALRGRADPLELELGVPAQLPVLRGRREGAHPPKEIHRPQRRAGHGLGGCGKTAEGRRSASVAPVGTGGVGWGDRQLDRTGNPGRSCLLPHLESRVSAPHPAPAPQSRGRAQLRPTALCCSLSFFPSQDGDFFQTYKKGRRIIRNYYLLPPI